MEWLNFSVKTIEALAWPATVVSVVVFPREQVKELRLVVHHELPLASYQDVPSPQPRMLNN